MQDTEQTFLRPEQVPLTARVAAVEIIGLVAAIGIAVAAVLPWAHLYVANYEYDSFLPTDATLHGLNHAGAFTLPAAMAAMLLIALLWFGIPNPKLVSRLRLLVGAIGVMCVGAAAVDGIRIHFSGVPWSFGYSLHTAFGVGWYMTLIFGVALALVMIIATHSSRPGDGYDQRRPRRGRWLVD